MIPTQQGGMSVADQIALHQHQQQMAHQQGMAMMAPPGQHYSALAGQKRMYGDHDLAPQSSQPPQPPPQPQYNLQMDDNSGGKRKGRKKSYIWSHTVTDDMGKVHCRHCGMLIRVNFGEKV